MIKLRNALGIEKILPETIIFRDVPLEINVPVAPLVNKHGGVKVGESTILPRAFELRGRMYYPNKDKIRQEFDDLLPFLMKPPIDVWRDKNIDRFLRAYPQGAPHSWIDKGRELEPRLPMIALNPFWQGPEVTVGVSGTQTITVDGTASAIPLIATTGSASSLTANNQTTGREIIVTGANGIITVDNRNHELWIDNTKRLDLANDEWLLHGFELKPGENLISTNTPITMTYRPRYY